MADTTVGETDSIEKLLESFPKLIGYSQDDSTFDVKHFLNINGDCDISPNNNVLNMELSNCYVDGDCSSSMQQLNMTSYTNSPYGESSSQAPSHEFGAHSIHPADTTAQSDCSIESQLDSNCFQIHNDIDYYLDDKLREERLAQLTSLELSNGVLKKPRSSTSTRGRPRRAVVATYHSQISGDKNAIKIRIKKSNLLAQLPPNKKKSGRRKKHKINSDTDNSDHEIKRKRVRSTVVETESSHVSSTQGPFVQSGWANLPSPILYSIFRTVCLEEGCLPVLVRLCKVCRRWRDVASTPQLWHSIDLNKWARDKLRTDLKLHWLIQNRLTLCRELNLSEWKVNNIQVALEALSAFCPELAGLTLSGWKGLTSDHLKYLTAALTKLERLDLSSMNDTSTSAMNAQPLVSLAQTMNGRLTHLVLANNKLAGFTQIITAIASNCPNLQLLDISNIRTYAQNTALLHIEKLQCGCSKLRVLRITNSQIWFSPISLSNRVVSPGFPLLEELSLAGVEGDQITARVIDDDGLDRLVKSSTKLRLLDVRGCIRLSDSGLVRVPAWDLEHLFLSACYATRTQNAGLELIVQKWSHSLLEVDLAWTTATTSLDAAVLVLAEKGIESPLRSLNLCGSSVNLEPVKEVLRKCPKLRSINLQSCRALPRGIKRLYTGSDIDELREILQAKPKTDCDELDTIKNTTSL